MIKSGLAKTLFSNQNPWLPIKLADCDEVD